MIEFKLKPVDDTPIHNELIEEIAKYLYWLPVGPRKYRDIRVASQAIRIIIILNDILVKYGYKIVKE